jgi:retinol dehydrogenase-12
MVENAGVAGLTWSSTADGWENMYVLIDFICYARTDAGRCRLQVNCLSTGLLALLVTPVIARTAKLPSPTPDVPFTPHLTLVSSEVHMWAAFKEKKVEGSTLAALNTEAVSDPKDRYNVSKLIDVFMSRELASLAATKDIIVNNVNPGESTPALVLARILTLLQASASLSSVANSLEYSRESIASLRVEPSSSN